MLTNIQMTLQMNDEVHPTLKCATASVAFGRMNGQMGIVCSCTSELLFAYFAHIMRSRFNESQKAINVFFWLITLSGSQCAPVVTQQIIVDAWEGFRRLWQRFQLFNFAFDQFGWGRLLSQATGTCYRFGWIFSILKVVPMWSEDWNLLDSHEFQLNDSSCRDTKWTITHKLDIEISALSWFSLAFRFSVISQSTASHRDCHQIAQWMCCGKKISIGNWSQGNADFNSNLHFR